MREISETISQREIVQIQDRYARLVLNMPVKEVKKAKPREIKPVVEKKEERVKKVEEKKEEIIPPPPEIPEVEIKMETKYDIKERALDLEAEEKSKIDLAPKMEIPDISLEALNKYDVRESSLDIDMDLDKMKGQLTADTPEIDVQTSDKYKVRESAMDIDISDSKRSAINVSQQMPEVNSLSKKKYGTSTSKRSQGSDALLIATRRKTSVKTASNVPVIKTRSAKKYGTATTSKSTDISMGRTERRKRPTIAEKDIPSVQPTVSRKKYGGAAKRSSAATSSKSTEFTRTRKVSASKRNKSSVSLPQTAGIQNLAACVDSTEENRLKRKILGAVEYEGFFCEDGQGKFEFLNVEMISTLDIRFQSKRRGTYSRCDALNMALQCITN